LKAYVSLSFSSVILLFDFPARKPFGLSLDPRPYRALLLSEFIGLICQIIQLLLPGDLITEIGQLAFVFQRFVLWASRDFSCVENWRRPAASCKTAY
jgi:hypothetical protein